MGALGNYELSIPKGFPQPTIPEGNELTQERIELGRMLFYDPVLSLDSSISCADCHHHELAFADNQPISPGVNGELAMRNAPTLTNVDIIQLYFLMAIYQPWRCRFWCRFRNIQNLILILSK